MMCYRLFNLTRKACPIYSWLNRAFIKYSCRNYPATGLRFFDFTFSRFVHIVFVGGCDVRAVLGTGECVCKWCTCALVHRHFTLLFPFDQKYVMGFFIYENASWINKIQRGVSCSVSLGTGSHIHVWCIAFSRLWRIVRVRFSELMNSRVYFLIVCSGSSLDWSRHDYSVNQCWPKWQREMYRTRIWSNHLPVPCGELNAAIYSSIRMQLNWKQNARMVYTMIIIWFNAHYFYIHVIYLYVHFRMFMYVYVCVFLWCACTCMLVSVFSLYNIFNIFLRPRINLSIYLLTYNYNYMYVFVLVYIFIFIYLNPFTFFFLYIYLGHKSCVYAWECGFECFPFN